jgi:ethanolamine ammonia-lyase large subunit
MDKDQLEKQFNEGRAAYTLLEKAQAEKAFIQMKADLMLKFENTGFKDDDDRREVWRKMQTIAWFEQTLNEVINTGKIAEQELKGFTKFKQKFTKG